MVNKESYSKEKIIFSYYIGIYTACLGIGTFFTLIFDSKINHKEKNRRGYKSKAN